MTKPNMLTRHDVIKTNAIYNDKTQYAVVKTSAIYNDKTQYDNTACCG